MRAVAGDRVRRGSLTVRVLMVAPEPVFDPRGMSFAIENRCRALVALGHEVVLVTYPMGADLPLDGVQVVRAPRLPGITAVRIGPSPAKLALDAGLFATALREYRRGSCDVLHTHQEAGALGWLVRRLGRLRGPRLLPHVHDMHDDLAEAVTNSGFGEGHPLTRVMGAAERLIIGSADQLIVICPHLAALATRHAPGRRVTVIHNLAVAAPVDSSLRDELRGRWSAGGRPVAVYTGTLEPYQGIPWLLQAMASLRAHPRRPRLVLVGGTPAQVGAVGHAVREAGLDGDVVLTGVRPSREMSTCLAAADLLVSSRSSGTNTPLKLYSYMGSGRPIVATRILSHTQVLDDGCAMLVEPGAAGLAAGIGALLDDSAAGRRLAEAARRRAETDFGPGAFVVGLASAYAALGGPATPSALARATSALQGAPAA